MAKQVYINPALRKLIHLDLAKSSIVDGRACFWDFIRATNKLRVSNWKETLMEKFGDKYEEKMHEFDDFCRKVGYMDGLLDLTTKRQHTTIDLSSPALREYLKAKGNLLLLEYSPCEIFYELINNSSMRNTAIDVRSIEQVRVESKRFDKEVPEKSEEKRRGYFQDSHEVDEEEEHS